MKLFQSPNKTFLKTLFLFFLAGIFELGGAYLIWLWMREERSWIFGAAGGLLLLFYGIIQTFQATNFHRTFAAYGGIFIVMAMLWGWLFDGIAPDVFDVTGGLIALIGVVVIFYWPRKGVILG